MNLENVKSIIRNESKTNGAWLGGWVDALLYVCYLFFFPCFFLAFFYNGEVFAFFFLFLV